MFFFNNYWLVFHAVTSCLAGCWAWCYSCSLFHWQPSFLMGGVDFFLVRMGVGTLFFCFLIIDDAKVGGGLLGANQCKPCRDFVGLIE